MKKQNQFLELLSLIRPETLIPVIEKGLEIEKLELIIEPESEEKKEVIRYSSVLLSYLLLRSLDNRIAE